MNHYTQPTVAHLKSIIQNNLAYIQTELNNYLSGNNLDEIESILSRLGRGGIAPHWFLGLFDRALPNYDGKTIGSIVEMVLLATIEKKLFTDLNIPNLIINPAKGVDYPQLELGVKSPSDNYCTSEPFFSTYERLLGNNYDSLVLLTNYQDEDFKKGVSTLSIKKIDYLFGSQLADKNLCDLALQHRNFLLTKDDILCKKFIQFLAHVNQSDFIANQLIKLLKVLQYSNEDINKTIDGIAKDFNKRIEKQVKEGKVPDDPKNIERIIKIACHSDKVYSIINCCNDWVLETHEEFARLPNSNEWSRFLSSPLDGKISISFALQWRYNFANLFK